MNRALGWSIIIALVLTLVPAKFIFSRDIGLETSKLMDWNVAPVYAAEIKFNPNKCLYRWKKGYQLTKEELHAFVMARVKDMRPVTDNWFDSAELFWAAYSLAIKCPEGEDDARQQWIKLALAAARRSLKQDPNNTHLARWCVLASGPRLQRIHNLDPQVSQVLVALYKSYEKTSLYPALHLYNIYCVLDATGDQKGARDALEDAYTLCPKDLVIVLELRSLREEMGDVSGAAEIEIVRGSFFIRQDTPIVNLVPFARDKLALAQEAYRVGRIAEAKRNFDKVWSALDKVKKLWRKKHKNVVPETGLMRNKCATGLGLIAIGRGDTEGALEWLKKSDAKGMWLEKIGYDLRLARKLSTVPSAREAVIAYLEKASSWGLPKSKEDAKQLLNQIQRAQLVGKRAALHG